MNMPGGQPNYDPRLLQFLFSTFLISQLFFLVMTLITTENASIYYYTSNLFYTILPLSVLVLNFISNRIFQRGIATFSSVNLQESLNKLTTLHLVRWALVEFGTVALIVATMISENHFFTAFALANIVYFATLRPKIFTFDGSI